MSALDSLADRKREIRRQIRLSLEGGLENKPQMDQQIVSRMAEIFEMFPGPVGIFNPLKSEPDMLALATRYVDRPIAFPKQVGSSLKFFSFKKSPKWNVGKFGINEPDPDASEEQKVEDLSIVCLPGMAFDRNGGRLGRGQGFYDRALADYRGQKVGVAYGAQVLNETLPLERHDVTVNYVVTENFLLKVKG